MKEIMMMLFSEISVSDFLIMQQVFAFSLEGDGAVRGDGRAHPAGGGDERGPVELHRPHAG